MFLTAIDQRARIKGSRDPLGFVPVWSRFGRKVVGNLTTQSNSLRGFTTLLLGIYFAQRAEDAGATDSMLDVFLRFEQLAAYARKGKNDDGGFRGIDRVSSTLSKRKEFTLSTHPDDQILSNQRTYGLWGLFTVPAEASGLLQHDSTTLTPAAEKFVESRYLPVFARAGDPGARRTLQLITRPRSNVSLGGKDAPLLQAVADLHGKKLTRFEADFYREYLLLNSAADKTSGAQAQLVGLLNELPLGSEFDMQALRAVTKSALSRGPDYSGLAEWLSAIGTLERFLVPAASAFGFLLSRDGQGVDAVAKEIRDAWGARLDTLDVAHLTAHQREIGAATHQGGAERLLRVAAAFSDGDFGGAVRQLIEHNSAVMQHRGGSDAWVRIENDRLRVRFHDELERLVDPDTLESPWKNSYFIDSLFTVFRSIRGDG